MEAGGGLVEDVEGVALLRTLEFGGELDALRFSAAELGGRLAEAEVAEPDLAEHGESALERVFRASSEKNSRAASTVRLRTSAMVLSRYFTSRVFGLKRAPWQVGQGE